MLKKLRSLFPKQYYSTYSTDKGKFVTVWCMWFGRVFEHKIWKVEAQTL